MKVTSELLKRYVARDEFERYFSKTYPDGVEFKELLKDTLVKLIDIHFLRRFLSLNEEEKEAYWNKCSVVNSINVWESFDIESSRHINLSSHVTDSTYVENSTEVEDSRRIYGCINVKESTEILHSNDVEDSTLIFDSVDVESCANIINSKHVSWSSMIISSSMVDGSSYCYCGENLANCHFCGFGRNLRDSMFTMGGTNESFLIFGKKVTSAEFFKWKDELDFMLQREQEILVPVKSECDDWSDRYEINRRLDSIFANLSPDFFGWVSRLPNYSDDRFINLFFRKNKII